jgi:CubicO group peptidase (beta-lactamase class C family)
MVIRSADSGVLIDLAVNAPPDLPASATPAGPTLAPEELAGNKLLALFDRAAARDFADIYILARRFGKEVLLARAAQTGSLGPLGMTASSFPASVTDIGTAAVTGYDVNPDGSLTPGPVSVCTTPAAGGLWTTAADLARFGAGWSSLLPGGLAREALRPHARIPDAQGTIGLGWLMNPDGTCTEIDGMGPGTTSSPLVRHSGNQVQVALTNRAVSIEPVSKRVLHTMLPAGLRAAGLRVP